MAGVMRWEHEAVREFRLTPVAHSLDDLRRFDEGGPLDVHLKIDTGMNRLGASAAAAEIAEAILALRHVRVEGLLSHFASAADFTSAQTEEQIREFGGDPAGAGGPRGASGADALLEHQRDRVSETRARGCRWCGRVMRFTDMSRPPAETLRRRSLR